MSDQLDGLGDFLKRLEWRDFCVAERPDLPAGVSPRDKPTPSAEAKMEDYRQRLIAYHDSLEQLRPGAVLFLRSGKFLLIGHVNEGLTSREDYEPDFEPSDVVKIAHLW
jgi:hypothetical protein